MHTRIAALLFCFWPGGPQSGDIDAHISALKAEDMQGRLKAAIALRKLGAKAEPAIPALVACLNDDRGETFEIRVGNRCAEALAAIGKPAVGPVLKALKSESQEMFAGAAQTVMLMQPPPEAALETLFAALADREEKPDKIAKPRNRAWVAAKVLAKFGAAAQPATGDLITMLHSENFHEQIAASEALGAIGPTAKRAVPRLMTLVAEGNTSSRGLSAIALAQIGPVEGFDILPPIERAARDFSAVVRGRAMMAFSILGPKAKPALPTVHKYLRDKSYRNRAEAAFAAWKITGDAKEPVDVLVSLADELDFELDALLMIGKMGPAAKDAVPTLLEMLETKDPDKRFELVQTLKIIAPGSNEVQKKLKKLATTDPDADVRRAAKSPAIYGIPK
jgi:HEAT repeat protein